MKTLTVTWTSLCEWKDNDYEGAWHYAKFERFDDRSCYFRILGLEVSLAL